MKEIYIVMEYHGCYEDVDVRLVKAFENKSQAEKLAKDAEARYVELLEEWNNRGGRKRGNKFGINVFDPEFEDDIYTEHVSYVVEAVILVE